MYFIHTNNDLSHYVNLNKKKRVILTGINLSIANTIKTSIGGHAVITLAEIKLFLIRISAQFIYIVVIFLFFYYYIKNIVTNTCNKKQEPM